MKFLLLLAFTLLAVNVFVAADEEEDEVLKELLNENQADEADAEEGDEPRFAREVEEDDEEGNGNGKEPPASDPRENNEPEEDEPRFAREVEEDDEEGNGNGKEPPASDPREK